jgi:PAS domain S-box-containing protein
MSLGNWLLDPSGLTPHGFCLSWVPGLIALHAGSDAVVGVSYFSIPLALAWFVRQRRDLGYTWLVYAFVAFIVACGTTHLLAILTLWVPAYGFEGVVKLVTAVLSVATAATLWPLIPRLVALPSPAQLREVNAALADRISGQERTAALLRESEARVRAANSELERRVAERTADLLAVNAQLTEALAKRTRAEQALARSEAEFRAGFDAAAVGTVLADPQTRRIVRVNRAFAAMLGYEPVELVGRDGLELLLPEDRAPNREAYGPLLAGQAPVFVREARCVRRDGTALWTRISTSIARDPQTGDPTLNVALIEDIDAQYRAEADLRALNATLTETLAERDRALHALARSEAEFRAGFAAAAVGIVLTEPESRHIVRVNSAFASMLGYEPDELAGRNGGELLLPEDRAPTLATSARMLSGEFPSFIREARCMRRDGTPLWTRISSSIARDPQTGKPALTVAVVEDIDARYRAEAELLSAKRDLERVVDERTAALRQRDLLLREVYHRVKNNLQIVDGLLTMQARQLEDPEAKRALMGLRGRIYALGLVHQQLMGSADLKTFDVAPFLRELSKNIVEGGAGGGVTLSVEACPLRVGLDFAVPLGLLVTELVTNSLRHAFPGGAGTVSVLLQPGAEGEVVLVVSDDGQPRMQSRAAGLLRSGLGLRIIEGLVAQLGGRMAVRHEGGTSTEIRTAMPVQP